jgi:hypothetical protein
VRSLALWYVLRQLLEFDVLFISELTQIVNKLQTVLVLAVAAICRLLDLGILQSNGSLLLAVKALEQSSLHLGVDLTRSDDNTSETNESVYVSRAQVFDLCQLVKVLDAHHQPVSPGLPDGFLALAVAVFHKEFLVEAFENEVEATDHLGGKVDKLVVELPVVLLQMGPLHLKYVLLQNLQLVQLTPVNLLPNWLLVVEGLDLLKVHDEVLQSIDDVFAVDVGPVDDSDLVTREGVCLLDVLRSS